MDEQVSSSGGTGPAVGQRRRFGIGKGLALLVGAAVVIAFVLSVVVLTRAVDPFAAGSVHDVTLERPQLDCAYWYAGVAGDSSHRWRNLRDAPSTWVSPVEGQLRVIDDGHAEFEFEGVTIPMGGGDMFGEPRRAFTSDCPSTLEGR